MESLPDEVLVHILGMISAYGDSDSCAAVNHRFRLCVHRAQAIRGRRFLQCGRDGSLQWLMVDPGSNTENVFGVGQRYSHASVYDAKREQMLVFGGCTSTSTTFNDLWALNLTTHTWTRVLSGGVCPSPKACCTMVLHPQSDRLVLFGGWTHPSLYPLHQTWKLFNELHILNIEESKWQQLLPTSTLHPPPMAGHSASIHGNVMVVFGGLQKQRQSIGRFTSSNDVWCFDLETLTWHQPMVGLEPKPSPRYGQSQLFLDPNHLLIIGGCGGPNQSFSDVWLLSMLSQPYQWAQCQVINTEHSARHLWCHPACKMGPNLAAVLCNSSPKEGSRYQWSVIPQLQRGVNRGAPSIRRVSPAVKESQRIASFQAKMSQQNRQSLDESSSAPEVERLREPRRTASLDHVSPPESKKLLAFASNAPTTYNSRNVVTSSSPRSRQHELQQHQLETLKRINSKVATEEVCDPKQSIDQASTSQNIREEEAISRPLYVSPGLELKILDISEAVIHNRVTWLPTGKTGGNETASSSNMETILYSLVEGKSELIMFGGVNKDVTSTGPNQHGGRAKETVSNALFILRPPSHLL